MVKSTHFPFRRHRGLAAAALFACMVFLSAAFGEDPWRGNEWAGEIAVPAGGYHASGKTVKMKDEPKVTVGPGAAVENVKFDGKARWNVTGSFFKDVLIAGDLGLYFKAADSAFEMCDFRKAGGWFVQYWSTKWRFENCVFARQFFGHTLGVTDYSVRAVNCTFYHLEMPAIGYKKDPAKLAQSDDLKFEKCRFVNCSIPESVLAATIGCVFENCTFPGKREDWSKAEQPIAVRASIVSRANPPRSYENGPLKVEFSTLAAAGAGATIPVTNNGGRLTHSTIRPGNARKLGDLDGIQTASAGPAPAEAPVPAEPAMADASPAVPVASEAEKKAFFGIPVDLPRGATASPVSTAAAAVPDGKQSLLAPLFVAQSGGGFAAMPVRVIASISRIGRTFPAVVTFPQFAGADGQRALASVKAMLAKQQRPWGKGQRIDIVFSEAIVPADLESALFAAALLVDATFNGRTLDPRVAVTGRLDADGSVNAPPWLTTRMMASLRGGVRRMVAPEKGAAQVADLMLSEGVAPFASMQIFGANSFEEAPDLVSSPADPAIADAMREFGAAQEVLAEAGDAAEKALHDPRVMEAFRTALVKASSHLSARILLGHGSGRFRQLSLAGSVEIVENRGPTLVRAVRSSIPTMVGGVTPADLQEQMAALTALKEMLDDRALPWYEAILRYADAVRLWHANPRKTPAQTAGLLQSLGAAARVVQGEWPRLVKTIQGTGR